MKLVRLLLILPALLGATLPGYAAEAPVTAFGKRPALVWQHSEAWRINALCFSPDGRMLATGRSHGERQLAKEHAVKLWDVSSGKLLRTCVPESDKTVNTLGFSRDGKVLAGSGRMGTITLWDAATGEVMRKTGGHTAWDHARAFSDDAATLASSAYDGTIRLWNIGDGKAERILTPSGKERRASPSQVAFSPGGRTVAAAYPVGNTIHLWDARSGKLLHTWPRSREKNGWFAPGVKAVCFSPDGQMVAGGLGKRGFMDLSEAKHYGMAAVWDVKTGKRRRIFRTHRMFVNSLAFAPDGQTLLTGGDEGTVQLHDVRSGRTLHILRGQTKKGASAPEVTMVAYSPDGRHVAAGCENGFIRMWRVWSD